MKVGELGNDALRHRLRTDGIRLVTGAFTFHLHIELPHLVDEFVRMYADYPVAEPGIVDARLRIAPSSPLSLGFAARAQAWIDGEKPFRPLPLARAYTAFESSLNYCIATLDLSMLLLHAAVLERDGRALLMPAPSGGGKSTLCAALALRGWRLLSDETALISCDDGLLRPNPRPISLKNASIDVIARYAPGAVIGPTYRGTPKGDIAYLRAPTDAVARCMDTARPALVVAPRFEAEAPITLNPLEKGEGFRLLTDNAVNYSGLLRAGFETLAGAVEQCEFYELTYSDLDSAVDLIGSLHGDDSGAHAARRSRAGGDIDHGATGTAKRDAARSAAVERAPDPGTQAGTSRTP